MVWWIVAALVLVPLVVLVVVAVPLRGRMARLQLLGERAQQRQLAQAEALRPRQEQVQAQLADLQRRSLVVQRRIAHLRARMARLRGQQPG